MKAGMSFMRRSMLGSRSTVAIGIVLFGMSPAPMLEGAARDETSAAVETRAAFGLPIDAATMASLSARPDEASERWGFPLTDGPHPEQQRRVTLGQAHRDGLLQGPLTARRPPANHGPVRVLKERP